MLHGWICTISIFGLLSEFICESTIGGNSTHVTTDPPPLSVANLFMKVLYSQYFRNYFLSLNNFVWVILNFCCVSWSVLPSVSVKLWLLVTAWNFTEDVFRMNLILASASASPVAPLHLMGPKGASLHIDKQAPRGALFRSDLAWSGKRWDTYSYVISTGARNSSCCPCRLRYGST
jgi:hypothetical protein